MSSATWMRRGALAWLAAALLSSISFAQEAPTEPAVVGAQARRVVTNRIAVKARQVTGRGLLKSKLTTMGFQPASIGAASGETSASQQLDSIGVSVVSVDPAKRIETLNELARSADVSFAAPIYKYEPQLAPNDPSYGSQYHHALIGSPAAWDVTTGSTAIPIAILDTGVDSSHPDLVGKVRTGFNFHDNNTNTTDTRGHGTATAGAAAAVGNNAAGVAGIAWNCPIIPCRISDPSGSAYSDTIAAAIKWAADNGARVINCSYGPLQGDTVIESAAQYARNRGILVLVSSGNEGVRDSSAESGSIMFIGASNASDSLASYSTTGPAVKLVAPGDRILTTQRGGGYANFTGTSFSSPIVAGAAALVFAANPNLVASDVEAILTATAKDLGSPGRDEAYGFGRVNVQSAVEAAALTRTDPKAQLLNPRPQSVLTASTVTFSWSPGAGVSAYHLYVGTPTNSSAYYNSYMGLSRSVMVGGLPLDGSTIRVWLYSLVGGSWQANIYDFTSPTPDPADLTSPSPGSVLPGKNVTFQWSAAAGARAYALYVGTAATPGKYYNSVVGTARSISLTNLPTDGSPVRVTVSTQFGSQWFPNTYDFTAATAAAAPVVKAELVSPAPGSTLNSTSVTFQWKAAVGASVYQLIVGTPTVPGKFYNSHLGLAQSITLNGLPADGSPVRVVLNSVINGVYESNTYDFTGFTAPPVARATLTSPVAGTELTGNAVTFTWSAPAPGLAYWLYVGTVANAGAYYNSYLGGATSVRLTNMPTDGSGIRVWVYTLINGSWQGNMYDFTAARPRPAEITVPTTRLTSSVQTFQWDSGSGVSDYWLYVGTTANSSQYYNSRMGAAARSVTIGGLPTNGAEVRVWLYSNIGGTWQARSYVFATGPN